MHRWSTLSTTIVLAVLGGAGCATVRPDVSLQLPGDVNPDREDAIVREFGARLSAGATPVSDVRVVDAMLTPNVLLSATASRDGQFLGRVQLTAGALPLMMSVWEFPDYADGWRKAICYPQVILTYASALVWSLLPPSYPCWSNSAGGVTKRDLIEDLKLLTGVLGGNLAVASFSTSFESDSSLIATVSADVYRSDAASLPEARGPLLPPAP